MTIFTTAGPYPIFWLLLFLLRPKDPGCIAAHQHFPSILSIKDNKESIKDSLKWEIELLLAISQAWNLNNHSGTWQNWKTHESWWELFSRFHIPRRQISIGYTPSHGFTLPASHSSPRKRSNFWNPAIYGLVPSRIFMAFVYLEKYAFWSIYTLGHEVYWATPYEEDLQFSSSIHDWVDNILGAILIRSLLSYT